MYTVLIRLLCCSALGHDCIVSRRDQLACESHVLHADTDMELEYLHLREMALAVICFPPKWDPRGRNVATEVDLSFHEHLLGSSSRAHSTRTNTSREVRPSMNVYGEPL
ncbi:hypothetical protein C8R44DRAFT_792039 [Mycena epipterygia]|nr:hypothetical protein C8R44DRAFT_792039 [Mycena epipterygia]